MQRIENDRLSNFFTNRLMLQVTDFNNFKDFLKVSGFNVTIAEEFDAVTNVAAKDEFVAKHSQFKSWSAMVDYFQAKYHGYC